MAERPIVVPPPDSPYDQGPSHASGPDSTSGVPPEPTHRDVVHSSFPSGTYIVQVPKDQIYRVPPPANARIAEQHRNSQTTKTKRTGFCRCFLCLVLVIVVVLIVLGVVISVSILFNKPNNPVFRVDHLVVRNSTRSREYDLKLDAYNPNTRTGILYKEGGVASLYFKDNQIADGKYPSLHQGKKDTAAVDLVLKGSNSRLPDEVQKSLKGGNPKVHVSLQLNVTVPARMKFGFASEHNSNIAVTCSFTVDTLGQGSRVLSQSCQTTRHHR